MSCAGIQGGYGRSGQVFNAIRNAKQKPTLTSAPDTRDVAAILWFSKTETMTT
jgi:hypothetical protein